jgi:hypothetical protein
MAKTKRNTATKTAGAKPAMTTHPRSGDNTKPAAKKASDDEDSGPRVPYMDTDLGERNEDGLVVGQPEGFDGKKHLKPKRDDFATAEDFYEFQAAQCGERIAYFEAQREKWAQQAEDFRKYGDPEKRKMAKRADRLRAQLAELEAQLSEEGAEEVEG